MATAGFLPLRLVISLFSSGRLALRESHFVGALVPEQALS